MILIGFALLAHRLSRRRAHIANGEFSEIEVSPVNIEDDRQRTVAVNRVLPGTLRAHKRAVEHGQ